MAWRGFIIESKSYMGYPGYGGLYLGDSETRKFCIDTPENEKIPFELIEKYYVVYKKQWKTRLLKKVYFWRRYSKVI